jgi:hypothetical protein
MRGTDRPSSLSHAARSIGGLSDQDQEKLAGAKCRRFRPTTIRWAQIMTSLNLGTGRPLMETCLSWPA